MMPKGFGRAGSLRLRGGILFAAIAMSMCAALPAAAQNTDTASASGFPLSIGALIKATKNALGAGPAAPDYQRTRFMIGLKGIHKFDVFSLSKPNRVVIEMPNVPMSLPDLPPPSKQPSLVKSFRSGVDERGKVRVVIKVAAPVIVENARIEQSPNGGGGYDLVLDIVPVPQRSESAMRVALKSRIGNLGVGLGLQPPLPRPAETPKNLLARSFKQVIVIDPGHGGHDSGAEKFGLREKDVVLAFSLDLRDKLEATGHYRVLMTRDTDEFISLDGRREFADKHKAALFIAVHADYASTNASGATIYSLRDRVAERLKSSAKREVARNVLGKAEQKALHAKAPGVVRNILTDLALREVEVTQRRTDLLTEAVIREMGQTTEMRSEPHRSAAFRVIKTAKMPSILIELAYISNRRDARRLQSKAWRDKVSGSIVSAVDDYFSKNISRLPM